MTTPRTPHEEDDFRQLTGAFDRQIAPSPRFAEHLKARLVEETVAQQATTAQARPVSQRTVRDGSANPTTRRKWLDVAIAAALIVATLGGSLWYANVRVGNDDPSQSQATRYAAQPLSSTPISQARQTTANIDSEARGGSFGSTSDRAIVNPDLDFPDAPLTQAWSHVVSDPIWAMPYADVVVSLGSSELVVHNATTGDVLWSTSTEDAFRNETYDTERNPQLLLAQRQGRPIALPWVEGDTMYYATTTELVGVDLYSGEEIFRTIHTVPDDTSDVALLFFPWDTAVKDGIAYVLTVPAPGYYALQAIDLVTGETIWTDKTGDPVQDWSLAQTLLNQLIVTNDLVIMQAFEDETISILALNRSDGSMAWERESPFQDERANRNISAINDTYLVETSRSTPTGIQNGTPVPNQAYGVSLFDLSSGELLWEDTEGTFPNQESGLCLVVPGWDDTALYISCGTDDTLTMFRYPFDGNGAVERLGTWETPGPAGANVYDDESAYFNTGDALFRVNLRSGETFSISLENGESCIGLQASDMVVLCINDDGLGTFTVQAYTSASRATQAASSDATHSPPHGDPGNTNAYAETLDLSRTYTAESFGGAALGANEMLVVGDDLVFVGGALTDPTNLSIANPTLMSRDIATGEHNWAYRKPAVELWPQQIATDGEQVYAVLFNPYQPMTYRLIALDGATGEVLWETEQLHALVGVEPSERYGTGRPVAVSGLVLVSYGPEILIALGADTGEPAWMLAPGEGESLYPADAYLGGSPVVANGETAFRSLPDGSVQEIDLASGTVRSVIPGPPDQDIITHMTLHLQGDFLVIKREIVPETGGIQHTLEVHNIVTRQGGWTMGTTSSLIDIVVTSDTLIATEITYREASLIEKVLPFIDPPKPAVHVIALDLASGDDVDLFSGTNFEFPPAISAAGRTVCVAMEQVRCVDREGNGMVVQGYEAENFLRENPPVYWEGRIIIGNGMGPLTIAKPVD